jgi:hypothetical protein
VFVAFGLLGGSSLAPRRRPHFWMRVSLLCLGTVAGDLVLFGAIELQLLPQHVVMAFWLVLLLGALVVPSLCCYRSAGSPPGLPGDDTGGGGGSGPLLPIGPRGGIPLADAGQSHIRTRDHTRPRLHQLGPRRAAREPVRRPARRRAPTGS